MLDNISSITGDLVLPFQIEGADVRGRIARLGLSANTILRRHSYPEPVANLLGEALALTALMGTLIKYEGIFTLQARGDGPVSFLVADYATAQGVDSAPGSGSIRGYASFDRSLIEELITNDQEAPLTLKQLTGKGYLALTIDQGADMERYQGIVDLQGADLTASAANYFQTSEQLPTAIKLVAKKVQQPDGDTQWVAAALMIQQMPRGDGQTAAPEETDERSESWQRANVLMSSVTDKEMCDERLPLPDLLYRLFHEDGVRVFDPGHLNAGCRCGSKNFDQILKSFSREDLTEMADDGKITMTCEFCTRAHVINLDDVLTGHETGPDISQR